MSWNDRRKGWLNRVERQAEERLPAPEAGVVQLPQFPVFSPASFAAIVGANRSTVATWIADGKLDIYRDNLGEPYIERQEAKRFIVQYLGRTLIELP